MQLNRRIENANVELINYSEKILVVDAELFFTTTGRIFKKVHLTELGRKVVRHIGKIKNDFDVIIVGCVGSDKYAKEALYNLLRFQVQMNVFPEEKSYKIWLNTVFPKVHFAINLRRYYSKSSILISDDLFNKENQ